MLTTLLAASALAFPQDTRPTSRPTSPPTSRPTPQRNLSDEERFKSSDWGPDAPGDMVVPGKYLAIRGGNYGTADDVGDRVRDEDLVIGLVVSGQAFAYPINMLGGPQREIINEDFGGVAFCVNW
jgi:hypothetical protein